MRVVSPLEAVERGSGQVDATEFNQGCHVAEEEGQQQGDDVLAVHVGIGHEDDLVVAELIDIEFFTKTGAQGADKGLDGVGVKGAIQARFFNVSGILPRRGRIA